MGGCKSGTNQQGCIGETGNHRSRIKAFLRKRVYQYNYESNRCRITYEYWKPNFLFQDERVHIGRTD